MKAAIFASVLCIFSGFVSSRAVPDADASAIEARAAIATIQPSLIVPIKEAWPNTAFGPSSIAEVSRVS